MNEIFIIFSLKPLKCESAWQILNSNIKEDGGRWRFQLVKFFGRKHLKKKLKIAESVHLLTKIILIVLLDSVSQPKVLKVVLKIVVKKT